MDLKSACDWIAATATSNFIKDATWVIPTVQSIHILAIAALLASMAMLDLRLAGVIGREQSTRQLARRFLPVLWRALPVLLGTGIVMIAGEPSRELLNRFFWIKMSTLLVALLLTIPMQRLVTEARLMDLPRGRRNTLRAIALLSLLLWMVIVFCGRWIAY